MRFEFATAGRIVFGPGSLGESGTIASSLGRRALLVTGKDPARSEPLLRMLNSSEVDCARFLVGGEPSVQDVENGVEVGHRQNCDMVVSMGGGSAIDCGKAIAAMLANPGVVMDYLEVIGGGNSLPYPGLPFMAIPTTAGTGSEVTRNAVLASHEHGVKVSLRSPGMLPRVAVVDPKLTHDLPAEITATTGMDALTQVLEPFVSARANPMIDGLCREGLRRAARSLRRVYRDGKDQRAREDMAVVSLFGGLALANAGLGAVHGFAGPVGGMFPAPHGAVCAALLPYVMRANIEALRARKPDSDALRRYDEVAKILTGDDGAVVTDGVTWVRELVRDLRIPPLSSYGLTPTCIQDLVAKGRRASSMKANPIELTETELEKILTGAL